MCGSSNKALTFYMNLMGLTFYMNLMGLIFLYEPEVPDEPDDS